MDGDLESASTAFKKYYTSYPRGFYVELAHYYCGRALYDGMPDPRLDQTMTRKAIDELQLFLDRYPNTKLKPQTQEMIEALQDHLIEKIEEPKGKASSKAKYRKTGVIMY
jgi:outer membrane protein assembly factor BamD